MTATYNDPAYIHGSSRLTYNGEADNTVGTGHVKAPQAQATQSATPPPPKVPTLPR